jgi:hypothetical protein
MTWFETLVGFPETTPEEVRRQITVDDTRMKSHANGRELVCGRFETPSLGELRERCAHGPVPAGRLSVREVVADVQVLHADAGNAHALFQVASQFNALEMISPSVTPERGVGIYERDRTQGPACAIAAGAGTLYRNYFAPVGGRIGQSVGNQVDCLGDLGTALGNQNGSLWSMQNGYALPTRAGLERIQGLLAGASQAWIDQLRRLLRIGLQWDTQVTLGHCSHVVTQAYCSALPVAYSGLESRLWEPFARLVLEAAYEATLLAAILNRHASGCRRLYLTQLGGGAFGNASAWILESLQRALVLHRETDLEVAIVSYGTSNPRVAELVRLFDS